MQSRFLRIIWILLTLGAVVFGWQAAPVISDEQGLAPTAWIIPAVVVIAVVTSLTVFTQARPALLRGLMLTLRRSASLYWLLMLVYICLTVGWWVYIAQPTYGKSITAAEWCYLCCAGWLLIVLLAYDLDASSLREMGSKLGKSRLTGLLVTLTTILVIFWAAESYLRIYYITTDAYGFTAMNYWWYENFSKKPLNSLGYRDYEPLPDDPNNPITRIAVVGDSFVMGHGINNIDETFPQLLEKRLGPGYDVNLIARSGWDTNDEPAWLNGYYQAIQPRLPQIVILSYYLNDIDYLLAETPLNPDAVFAFPDLNTPVGWFTLNFFVPNYLYYNLAQFTSPVRNTNFTDRLIRAHLDETIWKQQEIHLQAFYQWTVDHDARLIVLLWPQLAAIEESQAALQPVRDFFTARDAALADMSAVLTGKSTSELIVNRFDSHPSVLTHRLTADFLYATFVTLCCG
jgi:hypothetical protein